MLYLLPPIKFKIQIMTYLQNMILHLDDLNCAFVVIFPNDYAN